MEIIVISAIFFAIVIGGSALAAGLVLAAVQQDQRYLARFEPQEP